MNGLFSFKLLVIIKILMFSKKKKKFHKGYLSIKTVEKPFDTIQLGRSAPIAVRTAGT